MRQLLNTLYVTSHGAYLAKDGETIVVRHEGATKLQIPVHTLGSVVCFGGVGFSPAVLGLCADNGVAVSFLTEGGRFLARVNGPVSGNVLLRREQYRRADDLAAAADVARVIVAAKVNNSRGVLLRALRDHPECTGAAELSSAGKRLESVLHRLEQTSLLDSVRGVEGEAAQIYFSVFDHLIVAQKDGFRFSGRNRRPPLDSVNALLSFLYTLLRHDVAGALEGVGLDPAVGFLHRDRPGRPGLALDLMEEMRPVLADRLALSLINRQQVKADGFEVTESGAVTMNDATRKEVLVAYQNRKQEEIQHPFLEEKIETGLIPHVQSLLLARHLRGELDAYPPMIWK
jgi:CRISPR-associated protein Cas1